jgi:MFS family permease
MGASAFTAAGVLSTIGGVSMASRFFTGVVLDRIGSRRVMILCFIPLMLGLLWLRLADRVWMLYVFACVYGLAYGGFLTAISPLVAEFLGTRAHGVLFGITAYFGTIGGSLGPILAGYLFDTSGSYRPAFWLITLLAAAGLALILFLRPIPQRIDARPSGRQR